MGIKNYLYSWRTKQSPTNQQTNQSHSRSGFTIIEVTLVLAISTLLLLLMMTGITLAVQRQRFSDSVNGLQSFMQQQFNLTQNTINNRPLGSCDPGSPGSTTGESLVRGSSACLVLGKVIDLQQTGGDGESVITSYTVIGTDADVNSEAYDGLNDIELISSLKPTVIDQAISNSSYTVPWAARLTEPRDATTTSSGTQVRYIALLRSPSNGVIRVYKLGDPIGTTNLASTSTLLAQNKDTTSIERIENQSVKMCLSSIDLNSLKALVEFTPTGSQDGVTTHFDDGAKETYGCVS